LQSAIFDCLKRGVDYRAYFIGLQLTKLETRVIVRSEVVKTFFAISATERQAFERSAYCYLSVIPATEQQLF
jgi:hypothetical protein